MLRLASTLILALLLAACGAQPSRTSTQPLRVALAGDSTQTDKQGYGTGFCANLAAGVECLNFAKGGASTRTFRRDGLWDRVIAARPDWVLIQFGHNDVQGSTHNDRQTDLATEYPANLRRFIEEARAAGIKPVLLTPITRRYYQPDGKIVDDLAGHVTATLKVAQEMNVPVIEWHGITQRYFESLGEQKGHELGLTKKDDKGNTIPDKTHFNLAGSYVLGRMLLEELGRSVPGFAPAVRATPAQQP